MTGPEDRALIGALLAEDYATVTENKEARFLYAELVADVLHDAQLHGQDPAVVLNRALRIYGREGGTVDIGGAERARIEVAEADPHPTEVVHERVVEREVVVTESAELVWEEPPSPVVERVTPHWEEPPDLSTRTRGRFQRFIPDLRENRGRPARIADGVSSSYVSGLRAKYGTEDWEFVSQRMRRNDKRSYRVWATYIGKPQLKCHPKEDAG